MNAGTVETMRLSDVVPMAIVAVDSRRRISQTNSEAESLFKQSRRSLVGLSLSEVIFHDSPLFDLLDKAARSGGDIATPGIPVSGPSMSGRVMCDVRVRPLVDGGFVLTLSETLGREANDTVAGVAGFGRILGHEVKNPLMGILGAAQLLQRDGHAAQTELLEIIKSESRRIERLVTRLSAFELFSAPRLEGLNIHALLDRVLAAEQAALGKTVEFARDYDPSLPDIQGDVDHLHEAFQNLIRNAAEAASSQGMSGTVTVRTAYATGLAVRRAGRAKKLRRAILVTIEDTGPGVSTQQQATMFDVFQSSKSGARGLGLSIVSEVVLAHGGHIRVDSQPGLTQFNVLLPLPVGRGNKAIDKGAS